MTNKEKIKRAFDAVQIPEDYVLNLEDRKISHKTRTSGLRRFAAAACTILAVLVGGTACYAADVGGIQRTIQIWLNGDQTDAVLTIDPEDGITKWTYQDENGNEIHGGGVAINDDGTDSPLSEEDIKDFYESPDWAEIDGRIYITCKDQKIDITDKFDEDGICHVIVKDGKNTWYVITNKTGRMMSSPYRYEEEQWAENNADKP